MIQTMRCVNIELNWIDFMFTSRIVSTDLGSKEIRRAVTRRTSQGDVIPSLLWLLVVNKLLKKLENKGVATAGYAHDVIIIAKG